MTARKAQWQSNNSQVTFEGIWLHQCDCTKAWIQGDVSDKTGWWKILIPGSRA